MTTNNLKARNRPYTLAGTAMAKGANALTEASKKLAALLTADFPGWTLGASSLVHADKATKATMDARVNAVCLSYMEGAKCADIKAARTTIVRNLRAVVTGGPVSKDNKTRSVKARADRAIVKAVTAKGKTGGALSPALIAAAMGVPGDEAPRVSALSEAIDISGDDKAKVRRLFVDCKADAALAVDAGKRLVDPNLALLAARMTRNIGALAMLIEGAIK